MSAFHDLKLKALDGQELPLEPFKGQVVLVVNVASKCGLTPQYAALENLYQQYKGQGFSVLGLPCNQFAGQEPGSEQEIQEFCSLNYGVTFPLSSKLEVNGPERHQLYRLLAGEGAEFPGDITWNFEKFLLGKDGRVKVLDFGLAKATDAAGDSASGLNTTVSPSLASAPLTLDGVILGTAAYMSPEQARGHRVDQRAEWRQHAAVALRSGPGPRGHPRRQRARHRQVARSRARGHDQDRPGPVRLPGR